MTDIDYNIVNKYRELVSAIFDSIEYEYGRLYWNKNQREACSPFANYGAGTRYKNKTFSVHAYDWESERNETNFKYKDFRATWYKYSPRDLVFWREDGEIDAEFLNTMLNDCIESMQIDFGEK